MAFSFLICLLTSICQRNPYINDPHYPSRHNLPSSEFIIRKKGYTASFDCRTKLPKWVAERLTHDNLKRNTNRAQCRFEPDPEIPAEMQATEEDYKGSRMSHGHLAMAALHSGSAEEMQETFSLLNIVPQDVCMNHNEWLTIENFQIDILKQSPPGCVLYVVSGPLWLPRLDWRSQEWVTSYRCIGSSQIPVPTDLFKVMKFVDHNGESAAVGFIVPNVKHQTERDPCSFKVDIEKIEALAGLDLMDMKSKSDLCHSDKSSCEREYRPDDRTFSWKLAWRLKIAKTIEEVRSVVRVALKRNYFNKDNPSLILSAIQRAEEFCDCDEEVIDTLTPLDCKRSLKYRDALKDALSSVDE